MKANDVLLQKITFKSDDFRITVSAGSSKASQDAFHPEIEIKLFYEGDAIQTIGNKTIVATAGDITIVNPYEVHACIQTDFHNSKCYLILIDLDFFKDTNLIDVDLRTLLITHGAAFNNHIKNNKRLEQILMHVIEEVSEGKAYYQTIVRNLMAEFFSLLLRDELNESNPRLLSTKEVKKATAIAPAITKILNDYDKHIAIDDLAELCHLSKFYFCRVFKEVMGDTPTNYINNHRIRIAKAMLRDKSKSIQQIATLCGYNDVSYFYRCYKKVTGQAPQKR